LTVLRPFSEVSDVGSDFKFDSDNDDKHRKSLDAVGRKPFSF